MVLAFYVGEPYTTQDHEICVPDQKIYAENCIFSPRGLELNSKDVCFKLDRSSFDRFDFALQISTCDDCEPIGKSREVDVEVVIAMYSDSDCENQEETFKT